MCSLAHGARLPTRSYRPSYVPLGEGVTTGSEVDSRTPTMHFRRTVPVRQCAHFRRHAHVARTQSASAFISGDTHAPPSLPTCVLLPDVHLWVYVVVAMDLLVRSVQQESRVVGLDPGVGLGRDRIPDETRRETKPTETRQTSLSS